VATLQEECKIAYEGAQAAEIYSQQRGGKLEEAKKAFEDVIKKKDAKKFKQARKSLEDACKAAEEAYDKLIPAEMQSATSRVMDLNDQYGKDVVHKDKNCSKVEGQLGDALKLMEKMKKDLIDPTKDLLKKNKTL
jgi:hypothetical protein